MNLRKDHYRFVRTCPQGRARHTLPPDAEGVSSPSLPLRGSGLGRLPRGARSHAPLSRGVGGPRQHTLLLVWTASRPDGALSFPTRLGGATRGQPRLAPERSGGVGRRGRPTEGDRGALLVRCTGARPESSEPVTSARCGGLAPCRPPRAPGYPTLLPPPEGGGGFNVSIPARPRSSGVERPGVLSSPFPSSLCLRTLAHGESRKTKQM